MTRKLLKLKFVFALMSMFLATELYSQTNAWINEIHYDNFANDIQETVEIVIENPADLSRYTLYYYNGGNTRTERFHVYKTISLAGMQPTSTNGDFQFFTVMEAWTNDRNAGFALTFDGVVIPGQFISYESDGGFEATFGPALGMTSTDIGVEENPMLLGLSLQLGGMGNEYAEFDWQEQLSSTYGTINANQFFSEAPIITNIRQVPGASNVTPNDDVRVFATVSDDDTVVTVVLNWGTESGNLSNAINMTSTGGDYSTSPATPIPAQVDGTTVYYTITATDNDTPPLSMTSEEQSYISQFPPNVAPVITNILQSPVATEVTSSSTVAVNAIVIDDAGVSSVVLDWGTAPDMLNTQITMGNGGAGDDYTTMTDIPAQVDGTTIYYTVTAIDNDITAMLTTISETQDYTVDDAVNTAPTIQNIDIFPLDPVSGKTVVVEADVLDDASVGTVTLSWGLDAMTMDNDIPMLLSFDDRYQTDQDIPNQPDGTTVFYTITAIDEDSVSPLTTVSPVQQYTVVDETFIYENGSWTPNIPTDAVNPAMISDNIEVRNGSATIAPDFEVTNLTVLEGATLIVDGDIAVEDNKTFRVLGTITNNGTLDLRKANVFYLNTAMTSSFNIEGTSPVAFGDILISPGATINVNASTEIYGTLSPVSSATINTGNNLIFKSTATETGILAFSPSATITGNVISERFIPARRAFRLLASPVTTATSINANWQNGESNPDTSTNINLANPGFGTHITGGMAASGFDVSGTNNPSLFIVDEAATPEPEYAAVTNTTDPLTIGTGYLMLVRGDRGIDLNDNEATPSATTLTALGSLQRGTYEVPDVDINQSGVGNASSLVANPYISPVDMERMLDRSTDINEEVIHVYDPTLGDRGAFVSVVFGSESQFDITNFAGSGATSVTRYLQVGQACFVNTLLTDDPGLDVSLTFEEADKFDDTSYNAVFRPGNNVSGSRIDVTLYDTEAFSQGQKPRDAFVVRFNDNYSNSYIATEDFKKQTNLDENLGTLVEGELASIQSRILPTETDDIAMFISNYRKLDYTFSIKVNALENVTAYLQDNYLGTQTELRNNAETLVQFHVDSNETESIASDRFKVVFTEAVLGNPDVSVNEFTMYPNPVSGDFFKVTLKNSSAEALLTIYTILGQEVLTQAVEVSTNVDVSSLSSGVYVVKVTSEGKTSSKQLIIK